MRRKHKRILGVLLACLMCCVPAAQVMAATSYGVSEEAVAKVLFPGDSLTGMTAGTTVITENGETTTVEGDTWTNSSDSAKAYKVSSYTAETIETVTAEDGTETTATTAPASVTLETAGYVLTVVNGTSKTAQQEGGSTDNHYTFTDEEKAALENENTSKDIAYYKSGESVTITAAEAPEGYEFAGWSTDADGVTFADAASMETTITMPEKQVTITATYQEKVEETQAAEVADEAAADAAAVDSADTGAAEDTGESADQTVADGSDAGTGEGSGEDTNAVSSEDLLVVIEDSYNSEEGTSTDAGSSDTVENTASAAYSLTVNYDAGADSYLKTDTFSYTAGEIVTLSAESMEGYIFSYWFVSTMNIALDDTETETITFTMPEANVEILAEYAAVVAETQASEEDTNGESSEETTENPDAAVAVAEYDSNNGIMIIYGEDEDTDSQNTTASYTLTINYAADSGSISDSVNNTYEEGTTVPLDIKTIDGYTFSSWSESNDITITQAEDGSYSITMPGADVTITANYTQAETEAAKYSVTVDGVDAGSYAAGETVTVAQPDASTGQVFSSWQITNNASITLTDAGDGTWTFTMPDSEVALASAFDAATYTVTVVNGTTGSGETSGTFAYGSTVSIAAGTAEDGKTFSNWTSTGSTEVAFENASSATTTFTMPAGDVEVTAYYTNLPNTYTVKVSNGLINGTYTEHTYEEGTTITITASAGTNGQEFSGWTVTEGSYDLGSSASSSSITVTVNQDLAFAANYSGVKYNVTVTNGTADYTSCTAGTSVTITAAEPEAGYAFDYWTVDTANTMLASSTRQTTTFTMPSADVTVTAVYKQVKYTVTVVNGSTSQTTYNVGDTVTITSTYPASGKEFSSWTVTSGNVTFADASRSTTTFTMPASNVTITATYKDAPTEADNYIDGITEGGSYVAEEKLTFTPVGAGMSNSNPNPGDVRYVPTGYEIGNVSNTWSSSPYETSMSIKKTGEYTLKVTFARQVWDGSSWVADGTTSTTSVTFNIVTSTESVATGDTTPIIAVAAVAVVACLVFVALLVVFIRRRRNQEE